MSEWNPWHGCHKISAGCQNCYVYRSDAKYEKDSSIVTKTVNFTLPIRRNRKGEYKIPAGETVWTCFTSDFFVKDADEWRKEAWRMIRERSDLDFFMITKRIDRLHASLPEDWGDGYENVTICCTAENQDRADYRLPLFLAAPIRHKGIICEPLLGPIDLSQYLGPQIKMVVAGGESGSNARVCCWDWILSLREQCGQHGVSFRFKQTGAHFEKDGKLYHVPRKFQHSQARKAGINLQLFDDKLVFRQMDDTKQLSLSMEDEN